MTAPTRSKRPEGSFSDGNADMVRGSILIGIAVIIGVVLLYKGFGDDESTTVAADSSTTTAVTVPEGDTTPTSGGSTGSTSSGPSSTIGTASSTTTVAGKDPASITVRVANGSPTAGVAGKFTEELSGKGFTTVDAANGSNRNTATTVVYYTGDAKADAEQVAAALGVPATAVAAMPNPPPTEDGGLNGATVLVVIGVDKAS